MQFTLWSGYVHLSTVRQMRLQEMFGVDSLSYTGGNIGFCITKGEKQEFFEFV